MGRLAGQLKALKDKRLGALSEEDKYRIEKEKIDSIIHGIENQDKKHDASSGNHKEMMMKHEQIMIGMQDNIETIGKILSSLIESVSDIKLDVDLSGVDSANNKLSELVSKVSEIKPIDLSNVERYIKNIKPTNTKLISNGIDDLLLMVSQIEKTEAKEVDLSQVIAEINKHKTVEFEVITDSYGFPTKVVAKEYGN